MKTAYVILSVITLPLAAKATTIAHYLMEGTPGAAATTLQDTGPNGLDGSVLGAATFAPGIVGSSLDLTGDFDYGSVPHSASLILADSWTVELFFRPNQPYVTYGSDASYIICKLHTASPGFHLSSIGIDFSVNGHVYGEVATALGQGSYVDSGAGSNFNDGQWHHVALVYNAAAPTGDKSLSLYVDYARRDLVHGAFAPIVWGNFPLFVGAGNFPGGDAFSQFRRNFDGRIDELRISDEALAPAEFVSVLPARFIPLHLEPAGPDARLSWSSLSNHTYQLQYRDEVAAGLWQNLGGPRDGTDADLFVLDPFLPAPSQRFYRLSESP